MWPPRPLSRFIVSVGTAAEECDAHDVANVAVVLLVLLLAFYVASVIRRRVHGLVPQRGIGTAADLGALADKPRVRVSEVTRTGTDRVHVVLTPEPGPTDGDRVATASDLDLMVVLRDEDFGFELLHEWRRSGKSLAIVFPPESQIVRLRSIDDLQPLTLRRVDPSVG